jgi:hypothetical protein
MLVDKLKPPGLPFAKKEIAPQHPNGGMLTHTISASRGPFGAKTFSQTKVWTEPLRGGGLD